MAQEVIEKVAPYLGPRDIPIHEPIIAQRDERQFKHIQDQLMTYKEVQIPMPDGSNQTVLVTDKILYPDLNVLLASIGTLEGTSNYNLDLAVAKWFDWEEYLFNPIIEQYEHDAHAQTVAYQIRDIAWRKCFGDSLGGSRQNFVVQLGGSKRAVELITGSKEKKGLLGWLRR